MFDQGEFVVYGVHGVCRVMGREKQLVNRKRTEYLVLEPIGRNESRFYVPTANEAAMLKLQPVLEAEVLRALLESQEARGGIWLADEGARKQKYKELLATCDRLALMQMVSALYRYRDTQLTAGKKFHLCDDNFLRDAEKLLSSEIALVLEKTPEEAREYMRTQLK